MTRAAAGPHRAVFGSGGEALIGECIRLLGEALELLQQHSAAPRPGSPMSMHRWLPRLIDAHEEVRQWSMGQKSEFLERAGARR